MIITQEVARQRVAEGADHLDRQDPGWFNKIDITTLDMGDSCRCIVGQLTGEFSSGCGSLAIWESPDDDAYNDDVVMGLNVPADPPVGVYFLDDMDMENFEDSEWEHLRLAWIEAITDRLALAAMKGQPATEQQRPVRVGPVPIPNNV